MLYRKPVEATSSDGLAEFGQAIQAFLRGYGAVRSLTHPYDISTLAERIWVLQDGPRKSGDRRRAEVTVWDRDAADVAAAVAALTDRHCLCIMCRSLDPAEAERLSTPYRSMGYRLIAREPLFICSTAEARAIDPRILSVIDPDLGRLINRTARSPQARAEDLSHPDSNLRLYAAMVDARPVGWVSSVRTHADCAWVSNLFVQPEYRRQGLGGSLMRTLLAGDANRGLRRSVLLASGAGARLYPLIGYERIGTLLLFTLPRK